MACIPFEKVKFAKDQFQRSARRGTFGLSTVMVFNSTFDIGGVTDIKEEVFSTEQDINAIG